jgi:hypothetical protein
MKPGIEPDPFARINSFCRQHSSDLSDLGLGMDCDMRMKEPLPENIRRFVEPSFKLFGCTWEVIRSTPNFVAAKEVYGLRPFTVFRYSLQYETFGRDFSAFELIADFYVSVVGEYTRRSTAIRSLKTIEDQLQSHRKFFGSR